MRTLLAPPGTEVAQHAGTEELSQVQSLYWNQPRMTPTRGNPAWLEDNSRQVAA